MTRSALPVAPLANRGHEMFAIGTTVGAGDALASQKRRVPHNCIKAASTFLETYLGEGERPVQALPLPWQRHFVGQIGSQPTRRGRVQYRAIAPRSISIRPLIVDDGPDALHLGVESLFHREGLVVRRC